MQCPNDETTLVMSDRQGIEIDYCPTCRGVWLDRGELDKILERSLATAPALGGYQQPVPGGYPQPGPGGYQEAPQGRWRHDDDDDDDDRRRHYGQPGYGQQGYDPRY